MADLQSGLFIIPMASCHAKDVAHILFQAWEETYRGLMPDAYLDARTPEQCLKIAQTMEHALIAVWNGVITGFIGYASQARGAFENENASEIIGLYLLRRFHKKGIGRALLNECLKLLPCSKVVLYVLKGNESAIGFYEHLGFSLTGREKSQACPGGVLTELEMCLFRGSENRSGQNN